MSISDERRNLCFHINLQTFSQKIVIMLENLLIAQLYANLPSFDRTGALHTTLSLQRRLEYEKGSCKMRKGELVKMA